MVRGAARTAVLVLAFGAPGCGVVVTPLGPTPGDAGHRAGELLGALALRFGPIEREAGFDRARPKLLRASLVPSSVFDDETVWTARHETVREAGFAGRRREGRYVIALDAAPAAPRLPGDYRGTLELARHEDDAYEWKMHEELAVGPVGVAELAEATGALFRLAELAGPDPATALRRALPRARSALGRLLTLERVDLAQGDGGATEIRVQARVDPDALAPSLPGYARYLRRYATDTELSVTALDALGPLWTVDYRDCVITLHARVRDGGLAPLAGPLRRVPSQIEVETSFSMKSGLFHIGYRNLLGTVALESSPGAVGFRARFVEEPEWRLPFVIKPFLRSPLREPFEPPGSSLAFRIEQGRDGTVLVRDYRLQVRENWLVRWLGGRVGSAVSEFRRDAEAEADRFTAEGLLALRDDLLAATGS